jgi:hypothetical protein
MVNPRQHYKKHTAVTDRTYNGRAHVTISIPSAIYERLDKYAREIDKPVSRAGGDLIEAAMTKNHAE